MFKKHYEYQVLQSSSLCTDKQLNDLNKEGWRLITIIQAGIMYYFYFEREK
jgi:hypothetical protein